MKNISINAFLAEIDQNIENDKPVFFSITFVKKGKNQDDKEREKLARIEKASKGYKKEKNVVTDIFGKNMNVMLKTFLDT